jgi:IMP cyclohydrolase
MRCDIYELLRGNPYPGRGILIGTSEDGKRSIIVYFIMGRSENSRNRIFERTKDGIRTATYDPSKLTDPSLIIYHPVRIYDGTIIVTNGDQTDTIADFLKQGHSYYAALQTREFEPDAPNYTPRISGLARSCGNYALSILKTIETNPDYCQRSFHDYTGRVPGLGHFLSTYEKDGEPLPSFTGEPIPVSLEASKDLEAFANGIWEALDENNKVSLYVMERDIETGKVRDIIINKYEN